MSEPLDLDAAIAAAVTCIAGTDARELARTAVEAAAPLIERAVREQAEAERRVLAAARIWHAVRHQEISGMVFHRACKALDEAVAALVGELDREPITPPSEEEMEQGRDLVRRCKERSARLLDKIAAARDGKTDGIS